MTADPFEPSTNPLEEDFESRIIRLDKTLPENKTNLNTSDEIYHVEAAFEEPFNNKESVEEKKYDSDDDNWRPPKEKIRTVSVGMVLCLNLSVDPPGIHKPDQCARQLCWIDTKQGDTVKTADKIGNALHMQYEKWQIRAKYRKAVDPTADSVKKLCQNIRKVAAKDRALFHYNGYGVPMPTANGEIWVFNSSFTQYIPLSIYDLQMWMAAPSLYIWDCNNAGQIVRKYEEFASKHAKEYESLLARQKFNMPLSTDEEIREKIFRDKAQQERTRLVNNLDDNSRRYKLLEYECLYQQAGDIGFPYPVNYMDSIHLAACQEKELLPLNHDLPADLFTCCLTTPIRTALHCYLIRHRDIHPDLPVEILEKIPGKLIEKSTMLGELHWVFTAVTDTIAATSLDRSDFPKIFRQDLLLASLCRNFFLACRIMKEYDCHPVCNFRLNGPVHDHPLWEAWEYSLDIVICRLEHAFAKLPPITMLQQYSIDFKRPDLPLDHGCPRLRFFIEQLDAFELYIDMANESTIDKAMHHLPVMLQVMLSQQHRLRALADLCRFADLDQNATKLLLAVGFKPYFSKLLASTILSEMRLPLAFIWCKILIVDKASRSELVPKPPEAGSPSMHQPVNGTLDFFIALLKTEAATPDNRLCQQAQGHIDHNKLLAAFILALCMDTCSAAQKYLLKQDLIVHINDLFIDDIMEIRTVCPMLQMWSALVLSRLWQNCDEARRTCILNNCHENLIKLANVSSNHLLRAACIHALGMLMSNRSAHSEHYTQVHQNIALRIAKKFTDDSSSQVRAELIVALHWLVQDFEDNFITLALDEYRERRALHESNSVAIGRQRHSTSPPRSSRSLRKSLTNAGFIQKIAKRLSPPSPNSPKPCSRALPCAKRQVMAGAGDAYTVVWNALMRLANDPCAAVALKAQMVADYVTGRMKTLDDNTHVSDENSTSLPEKALLHTIQSLNLDTSAAHFVVGSPLPLRPSETVQDQTQPSTSGYMDVTPQRQRHSHSPMPSGGGNYSTIIPPPKETPTYTPYKNKFSAKRYGTRVLDPPSSPVKRCSSPSHTSAYGSIRKNKAIVESNLLQNCSRWFTKSCWKVIKSEDCCEDINVTHLVGDETLTRKRVQLSESRRYKEFYKNNIVKVDTELFMTLHSSKSSINCILFYDTDHVIVADSYRKITAYRRIRLNDKECKIEKTFTFANDGNEPSSSTRLVTDLLNGSAFSSNIRARNVAETISYLAPLNAQFQPGIITITKHGVFRAWRHDRLWDEAPVTESSQTCNQEAVLKCSCVLPKMYDTGNNIEPLLRYPQYFWEQNSLSLIYSVNRELHLWHANAYRVSYSLVMPNKRLTTCIHTQIAASNLILAGCTDGAIVLFDKRMRSENAVVSVFNDKSNSSMVGVHCSYENGRNFIYAGDTAGRINKWDPRMFKEPLKEYEMLNRQVVRASTVGDMAMALRSLSQESQLTNFEVHPELQMIACSVKNAKGSKNFVYVLDNEFQHVSMNDSHQGIIGASYSRIETLHWHPRRLQLAVATDNAYLFALGTRTIVEPTLPTLSPNGLPIADFAI